MAGGGAVVSLAAFHDMKDSMAQLVNLVQLQVNSVARLQREADVSKLKAQRAKSDKDGKKAGSIHRWRSWRRPCMAWRSVIGW